MKRSIENRLQKLEQTDGKVVLNRIGMNPFGKFLGCSLVRPLPRNTWNVLSR